MKKVLKIVSIILISIIICILCISYIETKNDNYLNNLKEEIKNHLNLNDEITYTNQYGNYYIIKTNNNVIVLTKDYREVLKESISKIKELNNYELIYKTNRLMYEKTSIKNNNTLIYEYYDAITGQFLKKTTLEKR